MIVHCHTGFPGQRISFYVRKAFRRDNLLGTHEVAMIRSGIAFCQRTSSFPAHFKTIVYDHLRLQGTHHIYQLGGSPFFSPHIIVGKIKPEEIQLSVIGTDFFHLFMHVIHITAEIPVLISAFRMIAHGMIPVLIMRIIFMIPVKQSEIKAYLQPFRTDCIHIFPHQIPSGLCVGCLILRIFAVKQTESVVVLGCQNHIFHSGFLCHARPFFRI